MKIDLTTAEINRIIRWYYTITNATLDDYDLKEKLVQIDNWIE